MWILREDVPSFIEREQLAEIKCNTLQDFLDASFRPHHPNKTKNKDFNINFKGARIYEDGRRLAYVLEGDAAELERQYRQYKDNILESQ